MLLSGKVTSSGRVAFWTFSRWGDVMLKKWPVQPVSAIFMNGEGPSGAIEFTVSLLSRLMLGGPLSYS